MIDIETLASDTKVKIVDEYLPLCGQNTKCLWINTLAKMKTLKVDCHGDK